MQRLQKLCRTNGLSVSSDVRFIQNLIEDGYAALRSADDRKTSLGNLKEAYAADKAVPEELLKASTEKFSDAKHLIKEFVHNSDTSYELATKVDEPESSLRSSEDYVLFFKDKVAEKSNQLF